MAGRATIRRIGGDTDADKESLAAENRICQQIDNLQRIAQQQRKDQVGDEWFRTVREAYNLYPRDTETPIFRPTMRIPEAQILGFMEAIDLTDIDPRIYICKTWENYEQDENAEACLQAQWRDANVNQNILYALMWAWYCGCGFIQVAHDEQMRNGRGDTTAYWRDPQTVFPDPYSIDDRKWQYVILEDHMWLDTIKQYWPIPAKRVTLNRTPEPLPMTTMGRNSAFGLEVPTGPMQGMIPGLPVSSTPGDARVRVRTLFLRDRSRVRVKGKDEQIQFTSLGKQEYRLRYPRGRMIVECNNVILFDGENPYLHGEFPVVRFLGMPALHGFWAPPPFRYTKALQDMAERFTTQDFGVAEGRGSPEAMQRGHPQKADYWKLTVEVGVLAVEQDDVVRFDDHAPARIPHPVFLLAHAFKADLFFFLAAADSHPRVIAQEQGADADACIAGR